MKKAVYINAWPYQQDKMNLPVHNVSSAVEFYESVMGFTVVSRTQDTNVSAVLSRDGIQIAICENGGDPTQDGCFFEVNDVQLAMAELQANGIDKKLSEITTQEHGAITWKVFFVIAPDGLCYCLGERQV